MSRTHLSAPREGIARRSALLIIAMLLMPTATADVLQVGVDASRAGVVQEAGPKLDEVAWTIRLPGSTSTGEWPIIIGDHVYIATSNMGHGEHLATNAIWEVSLINGTARLLVELDPTGRISGIGGEADGETVGISQIVWPHGIVSDGRRLYVTGDERVAVYDIVTGEEVWDWHYPALYLEHDAVFCGSSALTERSLFVGCAAIGRAPGDLGGGETQTIQDSIFVAALDLADQDPQWLWIRDPASELFEGNAMDNLTCTPATVGGPCSLIAPRALAVFGTSAFGGIVTASFFSAFDRANGAEYKATVGLDEATGDLRWVKQSPRDAVDENDQATDAEIVHFSFYPTGDDSDGYLAFRDLLRIDPGTGDVIESFDLAPRSEAVPEVGSSFALTEDRLFFTSTRAMFAIDRRDFSAELWATPLPSQSKGAWSQYPLTYGDGVIYGRVIDGFSEPGPGEVATQTVADDTSHFRAHDAATGELLWSRTIVSDFAPRLLATHVQTVGAGLMIVAGQDGRVVAIGRTDASLRPEVAWPSAYPAVGEEVTIDASATPASSWAGANASTEPSEFRVDWGDGTLTDWQSEPVFTHTYTAVAEQEVVLYVRNEAGQQSAEQRTLHVGGTPPRDLNFLQKAFQRENFGLTFGILGTLMALGGVAIVVVTRPRRRQRDAREEREFAYRRVLHNEVKGGTPPKELAERLRPLRSVLGITDKQHAHMEAEVRSRRAGALGSGRMLVPGETFLGRYEVMCELGSGGAGRAYLCRDERLGRRVVIKVHHAAGEKAAQAALHEARAFAAIKHDCVVLVHDVERVGDHVFLVLEYLEGGTLRDRLSQGPLAPREARRLAKDLLDALGAVHGAGLIHRDVKPGNVLIDDGRFKLGDFGIAQGDGDETAAAGFRASAGTPRYMAPEQARGERVDARSDLFAAALTLYEARTGAPDPGSHGDETPKQEPGNADLQVFFDRGLAVDPAQRFQDAKAMRKAALAALKDGKE